MKRRQLLLGVASVAGTGGLLGTGAFTAVSADRTVSVQVATDDQALLALEPTDGPNGEYATLEGGQLAIDLSSSNPTDAGGTGVNARAETTIEDVFAVENRGTQPVEVTLDPYFFDDGGDFVCVYPGSQSDAVVGNGSTGLEPVTLGVGDREQYDVFAAVALGASSLGGTVTVTADATN